jgi:hypothetical protein
LASLNQRDIDSGYLPDWAEFINVPDVETLVHAKDGFVFDLHQIRLNSEWRLRPSSTLLLVEYYNGAAWVEKGRFTP